MRVTAFAFVVVALCALSGAANAQAVTATCKDGTSWSGNQRSGACRGHQGVQAFGTPTSTAGAVPAATAPAAPGTPTAPAAASSQTPPQTATGGTGQVWVNTASHVYHCPGDRYYGHTKAGQYMTEAAAKSAGARPDHNKACS